ncbi:MAG: (d)CMP kinase [Firmicutes bacterium]|nr:(d)CMP kinase [Bacillota bacterium]
MKKGIAIAIDGPAGSGKSTVSKLVALKFNYIYIDSGAMYRAITLKALRAGVSMSDSEKLSELALRTKLEFQTESGVELRLIMDGQDVSEEIRGLEITGNVSAVAAVAGVRSALVEIQRMMAKPGGVVMDGRDIGTVVLPEAELKVFLTASVAERAKRRWLEFKEKGIMVELEEIERKIAARDYFDSHREADPLRQASDAILLDTTLLTIEQVVEQISRWAIARGATSKG